MVNVFAELPLVLAFFESEIQAVTFCQVALVCSMNFTNLESTEYLK